MIISCNDITDPFFAVTVTGNAVPEPGERPELRLDANSELVSSFNPVVDFENVCAGNRGQLIEFTINNTGNEDLLIGDVSIPDTSDFILDDSELTGVIPAGGSEVFSITFSPDSPGLKKSSLTITSNDSRCIEFNIELTGTAVNQVMSDIRIDDVENGGTSAFRPIEVGMRGIQYTFTIENNGDSELTISEVTISGDDSNFCIFQAPASCVEPWGETELVMLFDPIMVGDTSAILRITSNDPDSGLYVINMTGTGLEPAPRPR